MRREAKMSTEKCKACDCEFELTTQLISGVKEEVCQECISDACGVMLTEWWEKDGYGK